MTVVNFSLADLASFFRFHDVIFLMETAFSPPNIQIYMAAHIVFRCQLKRLIIQWKIMSLTQGDVDNMVPGLRLSDFGAKSLQILPCNHQISDKIHFIEHMADLLSNFAFHLGTMQVQIIAVDQPDNE